MSSQEIPDPIETTTSDGSHRPKRLLRSPRTWLAIGLATALLVGVGVGSFFLFSPRKTLTGRTTTAQAALGTQTASVAVDGTLSPRKQANLNFSVSGEVTKVYVKAGQKVTKGQKLAKIDSSTLADAVDLAEANLASARANYSDVSGSGTSAAIKAAAAQVDSAKAALSNAEENLKAATLRATFTGTVASVDVAVGDQTSGTGTSGSSQGGSNAGSSTTTTTTTTTSSSSAQIVLISTATWKLEGTVGAADLSAMKPGQAATITADSTEFTGTVSSVGIVATSTSDGAATFPVVINLSGTHTGLYSGTTASAVVTTGTYDNVLTIPTAAITTANSLTVVTKVDSSGATTVTEVEIGRVFGDATEITSGLSAGDTVQITYRPTSTSTTSSGSGGGFGGGLGGGLGDAGGGAPPAAGGAGGVPGR